MKTLQGEYAIGELCAAFEVSRSGFHRWRRAEPCQRAREDARISEVLRAVHRQSRDTYGRPRLVAALRQRGYRCSPKRVARLMRACKLRGASAESFGRRPPKAPIAPPRPISC